MTPKAVAVIPANPAAIDAYGLGVRRQRQPFPGGSGL